jgi:hypothetical protein
VDDIQLYSGAFLSMSWEEAHPKLYGAILEEKFRAFLAERAAAAEIEINGAAYSRVALP